MKLEQAVKMVDAELKMIASKYPMGSRCVAITMQAYESMKSLGFDCQIQYGYAAFSVNKTNDGVLSFGSELSDREYKFDQIETLTGGQFLINGHYWLRCKGQLLDFTMPFIDETVEQLDYVSGIPTGKVLTPKKTIISKLKMKSIEQIKRGAMGFYYELRKTPTIDQMRKAYGDFNDL